MISRRDLLFGGVGFVGAAASTAAYGIGIEAADAPAVRRYALAPPPPWPAGLSLRLGVIADLHACEPWMSAERVHGICQAVNAFSPDLVLLLGDFSAGHDVVTGPVMPGAWAEAVATLRAPLGTVAVLGNHDWWHGPLPSMSGGPELIRAALRDRRIPLLENAVLPVRKDGRTVWIAGLADQMARRTRHGTFGLDDLHGTLRAVPEAEPVILLAHEPYVFPLVPSRVTLTLSGHTHGGQVRLPLIGAPVSGTRRYCYGHVVEDGRHLIVSGGLGESTLPIRIGVPPEVLCVDVGGSADGVLAGGPPAVVAR